MQLIVSLRKRKTGLLKIKIFLTELNKHLVIIAGQSKENISISERVKRATDLTTLDAIEIDISEADERIQEPLMELVIKEEKN